MSIFSVFIPYIFLILALLFTPLFLFGVKILAGIIRVIIFCRVHQYEHVGVTRVFGLNRYQMEGIIFIINTLILFIILLFIFDITSSYWLRAKPTNNWEQKTKSSNTVIAFGFGIVEKKIDTLPGAANEALYYWIQENTNYKNLITQKGIVLAIKDNVNMNVIDMHPCEQGKYYDTFEAAEYALEKLDSLLKLGEISSQIVIVAYDAQLERAAFIMQKLADTRYPNHQYEFVVPEIKGIPFPRNSTQIHTWFRFGYNFIEMYFSRFRDFCCKNYD